MDEPARYYAFLSYSHQDRRFAGWLHRVLESYSVPSALVGTTGTNGEIPPKLSPIFRDREELAASANLGDRLSEAVVQSRFLIVVCSPSAAASHWTNEEIATFKRAHGSGHIFAAILAGEPNATDLPSRAAEECFPPALRFEFGGDGQPTDIACEPIAADFRPQGDGRRLAKLKLVAGLLGVPLDTLVQREAQRRTRRMAWLSAASLAGMAITSGLAIAAIQARDEARFQRGEASGLVQYMLTDLRKKLEPVGRLEVLDGVGQRALAYYEKQDVATLSADELGQRAAALNLVGEVRYSKGDLPAAMAAFRESARTTGEQLARDPDNAQRHFDHGQSSFWVGQVAWQRGDYRTARRFFGDYVQMAEWLVADDPRKPEWQLERSYAHNSLAAIDQEEGKDRDALRHFAMSEQALRRIGAGDPAKRDQAFQMAQTLAWSSKSYLKLGKFDEVIRRRRAESALYAGMLAADPKDFTPLASKLVADGQVGRAQLWLGQVDAAERTLAAAEPSEHRLMLQDPSNMVWREIAARFWLIRAEVALAQRRLDVAQHAVGKADAYCARLLKADAASPDWKYDCVVPARWLQGALANHRRDSVMVDHLARQFAAQFRGAEADQHDIVRFGRFVFNAIDQDPTNDRTALAHIVANPFKDDGLQAVVTEFAGGKGARAGAYPLDFIIGPTRRKP